MWTKKTEDVLEGLRKNGYKGSSWNGRKSRKEFMWVATRTDLLVSVTYPIF